MAPNAKCEQRGRTTKNNNKKDENPPRIRLKRTNQIPKSSFSQLCEQ